MRKGVLLCNQTYSGKGGEWVAIGETIKKSKTKVYYLAFTLDSKMSFFE